MSKPVWYFDLPGLRLSDLQAGATLPAFAKMSREGWLRMLVPTFCPSRESAQATLVTGLLPAFHGVARRGDGLAVLAPAWWERVRAADPRVPTLCGLWEPSLGLESPLSPAADFPGKRRNGEHILGLLRQHPAAAAAFRMHGVLKAREAVGVVAPSAEDALAARVRSMDRFVGEVLELAGQSGACVCVSGEETSQGIDPLDQPALLLWGFDPVGDSGVPKDTLGSAELAWLLLNQCLGRRWRDAG